MFRRRWIIILFVLGLLAVGLFLSWRSGDDKSKNRGIASRVSDQANQSSTATHALSNSPSGMPNQSSAAQEKLFIEAFKTPIKFYGKVLDQHGDPVPQADIKLSANDKPLGGRPSEYSLQSDTAGLFSIENITGLNLAIEVSKPGFRVIPRSRGNVTSSGLFEYSVSSSSVQRPHIPAKESPVLFMLYKPGKTGPLIKVGEKNFRIARDGSALKISLDQESRGSHEVILRCWTKDADRPEAQRQYDWRLEIGVPNGALVARTDEFAFEAPAESYLSSNDTIDMPATLPSGRWHGFAQRSYFIRFSDGLFARANLEVRAGGDHFVVWESYLNPKPGSRNLEYDPNQQINR